MNSFALSLFVLALTGCLLGLPAFAQTDVNSVHVPVRDGGGPSDKPQLEEVARQSVVAASLNTRVRPLKVSVDLVLVPVTITDPLNRLVTGLEKENFELFEGSSKEEIKSFSSEDAPVSLGVIFDSSQSMANKMDRAKDAVIEFFKSANPQDEFFMIEFSDQPQVISDFTNSVEEIQNKLVFTVPRKRTALLDAIYMGISKMRQAKYSKKALLIISDGGDNHSRYTEGEIKALVKEADYIVNCSYTEYARNSTGVQPTDDAYGALNVLRIADRGPDWVRPGEASVGVMGLMAGAIQLKAAGHEGDMDALRARAYLDLLTGTDSRPGQDPAAAAPVPAGLTGHVNLTIPVTTALDLADRPGDLSGFGPVDPWPARDLARAAAASPTTTWCTTFTDRDGHATSHG